MAVTSIWRVNGWLGKVVLYAENPDKTNNPAFYKMKGANEHELQSLADVIEYASQPQKTNLPGSESSAPVRQFVSGLHCSPATARTEMLAVKKRFGKEDGTAAYHGYQSFAPGEATPELAHEIGIRLAQALWGGRYQVLVATHLDKANHLHNHFVVNTVSFLDGIKYHRTEKDYHDMQQESDRLCREYGLSVIEDPRRGQSRQYGEWRAEQENRPTWRGLIKADIDAAIHSSMTERQFFGALKQMGYEIKIGKDISVRPPGKERFLRLGRNFGAGYTPEGIRKQLLAQSRPQPPYRPCVQRVRMRGSRTPPKKATGFRALYLHYCYLLGVFPRQRRTPSRQLPLQYREDLLRAKELSEEAQLLSRYSIDTSAQLDAHRAAAEAACITLSEQRRQLYRSLRTKSVLQDEERQAAVREEIAGLTVQIRKLRREVQLCEDISVRTQRMQAHKTETRKENEDVQFRRRSGTDRAHEP